MTELLQIAAVILLAFVWLSIVRASTRIAQQTASMCAYLARMDELLEGMDERLQDIEERIKDNFKTDKDRQREADMNP